MVLNADDPCVVEMCETGRRFFYYGMEQGQLRPDYSVIEQEGVLWLAAQGEPLLRTSEILLKGRHNLSNALAALALGDAVGLPRAAMADALRSFRGLDHRMQFVAEVGGVVWINDSKATNIGACIAALQGLEGKAVLIAGGDGKGADFSPLAEVAAEKVRGAVLMGQDAGKLQAVLQPVVSTVRVPHMKAAVAAARDMAQRGDTVLLSPACASWDQYTDYAHRGRVFAAAVQELRP